MNFKTDIMNIPFNQYVLLKYIYNISNIINHLEGMLLVKVILFEKTNVINHFESDSTPEFIKVDSLRCLVHGLEENELLNSLTTVESDCKENDLSIEKTLLINHISSYHILTSEEYPFLAGYCWLSDDFKKEAFII